MKNLKRFTLGLSSTVLLLVGLARMADKLDPLSDITTPDVTARSTPDSVTFSNIDGTV